MIAAALAATRAAPAAQPAGAAPVTPRVDRISPRGALWRSVLVPGWGQLATGHPRKAGLLFGGAAGLGTWIMVETNRAGDAADRARAATIDEEFFLHKAERDRHVDRRDGLVSWLLFLWMYNMLDAYIEGHFVDFEGLDLQPGGALPDPRTIGSDAPAAPGLGVRLTVSW